MYVCLYVPTDLEKYRTYRYESNNILFINVQARIAFKNIFDRRRP